MAPKIAPDEKLGPWKPALFLLRVGVARDDLGLAPDELFFLRIARDWRSPWSCASDGGD